MNNLIPLIFGMAAVTYGPRLMPFLLLTNKKIPKRVDAFLKCIPVAAIGALIIPGVFSATPDVPMAAISGIAFTLIFGLWKGGIIIPVLGSVIVTYVVLLCAG
ncbi:MULTISPECIES: AzlD domain-containing protein [Desulfobacula]|uniref:Prediced branched-chain amino acid transport protein, related to AzlD n=2 Tax=Desulfobacula TaxID=28222 RepID=K0NKW1_DESTT|nr:MULTISPECIES: AzlD domain-containing protein [Desulfobacula]CCK82216.1 prediced branched-chain amino acid transport protein, related to AzlD [Desulfobacula toluolica Tol2]SDU54912.1 Branched-chain amino acid transport protein (AzlD) [Desulfobacula phenolica]